MTGQHARGYKPEPEMFTTALGLPGLGPHEVTHIGGSLTSDVAHAARVASSAGNPVKADLRAVTRAANAAPGRENRRSGTQSPGISITLSDHGWSAAVRALLPVWRSEWLW